MSPHTSSPSATQSVLSTIRSMSRGGQPASALALGRSGYDEAVRRGDLGARADLATELAWLCMMLGHAEDGIAYGRVAAAVFEATGDRSGEAQARATLGWLLAGIGDGRALDEAERAMRLADGATDGVAAIAHLAAGVVYYTLGEHEGALHLLTVADRFACGASDRVLQGRVILNLATVLAAMAAAPDRLPTERAEAIRTMERALELAAAAGDSWAARIALCNLAELAVEDGRPEEGLALLERHDGFGGETASPDRAHLDHARAICRVAQGRSVEAETLLHRCLAECAEGNWIELRVQATKALAELLARDGRHREAYETHRRFHALYVLQSDDVIRRRARLIAAEHEMAALTREVDAARAEADALARSNEALAARSDLLLRHSLEDSLTGLPNRRRLDQELEALRATPLPYAVAMIDIDHFKSVNDELSHVIGDRVLWAVGDLMRSELRMPDLLARFGGEEFTAVIRTGDKSDIVAIGERLRHAIRGRNWDIMARDLRVTVSIGIALSDEAADPMDVLAIADQRLRRAKSAGRDRVVASDGDGDADDGQRHSALAASY